MILGACRLSGIQGWQAKLGTLISHCFPAGIQQGGGETKGERAWCVVSVGCGFTQAFPFDARSLLSWM